MFKETYTTGEVAKICGVSDFREDIRVGTAPQQMADHIVARLGRDTGDVLALVVRWNGDRA